MNFERSKKWRDWRQHIATECDALTRGMSPPIPLQEIFTQCNVKKVIFQPLLLEAALALDNDGFVVFVNCDENSKETYQLAFEDAEQRGCRLPNRIRFSLAHELAHTFFYDTKRRPYKNRLNGIHSMEIKSLEEACNFGASHLLLPAKLLKSDTNKFDVLTVNSLIELAGKYQVSLECLINRLKNLEDWTPKRGLIALIRQTGDTHHIKAIAKSVAVRELFKNLCIDACLETTFGQAPLNEMKQRNNGTVAFDLEYPRRTDFGVAKCRLEYRRVRSSPQTYVFAINVDNVIRSASIRNNSNDADHHIAKLRQAIKQRSISRLNSISVD